MRNVTGRENLVTCGRIIKLAHVLLTDYTIMAERTGLDNTTLHYLVV